jgi:hypothetical protein
VRRVLEERPLPGDGAEDEGAGRRAAGRARRSRRTVCVNIAESPLGWLRSRNLLTARQFEAGERLRADWERAQLPPRQTMRWDAAPRSGGRRLAPEAPDLAPPALAARRRFAAASEAVGPGLNDMLWRIVCAGEGMRAAEQALGWPARAGRLVLTLALDRLADHYRLP